VLCEVHPIIAVKKDELLKSLEGQEHLVERLANLEADGRLVRIDRE
jgi:hypothetical protein